LISKHKQKLNQICLTHENKPHWFSHAKQTCLSFHLPQLMCEVMNKIYSYL